MTYQPQGFAAPDGTELVVITREEYDRLIGGGEGEDARDIRAADRAVGESDVRYPAAVVDAMLAGATPLAAWRGHRGMSQAALAAKAGVTQAAIARLERQPAGAGRVETRLAIARALDVPVAALDPLED